MHIWMQIAVALQCRLHLTLLLDFSSCIGTELTIKKYSKFTQKSIGALHRFFNHTSHSFLFAKKLYNKPFPAKGSVTFSVSHLVVDKRGRSGVVFIPRVVPV